MKSISGSLDVIIKSYLNNKLRAAAVFSLESGFHFDGAIYGLILFNSYLFILLFFFVYGKSSF